jgi:hypothetical protein
VDVNLSRNALASVLMSGQISRQQIERVLLRRIVQPTSSDVIHQEKWHYDSDRYIIQSFDLYADDQTKRWHTNNATPRGKKERKEKQTKNRRSTTIKLVQQLLPYPWMGAGAGARTTNVSASSAAARFLADPLQGQTRYLDAGAVHLLARVSAVSLPGFARSGWQPSYHAVGRPWAHQKPY